MPRNYANELKSILDTGIPKLEGLRIAHSSLKTVLDDLNRWDQIGDSSLTFLAQGMKALKNKDSSSEVLKELSVWKKGWDSRPLPNEGLALNLMKDGIRQLARGEKLSAYRAIEDEECGEIQKFNEWNFFEERSGKGAITLTSSKGLLTLQADAAEVPNRTFKELTKLLAKQLGKPTGSAKNKTFKAGRFEVRRRTRYTACESQLHLQCRKSDDGNQRQGRRIRQQLAVVSHEVFKSKIGLKV